MWAGCLAEMVVCGVGGLVYFGVLEAGSLLFQKTFVITAKAIGEMGEVIISKLKGCFWGKYSTVFFRTCLKQGVAQ